MTLENAISWRRSVCIVRYMVIHIFSLCLPLSRCVVSVFDVVDRLMIYESYEQETSTIQDRL
jgi:hypothetical protein